MYAIQKFTTLAVIFVQLFGAIKGEYYDTENLWIHSDKTVSLPEGAVLGGFDPYGYYNYVGRVVFSTYVLPARIVPETGRATYNNESTSNFATAYSVLVSNATSSYHWVRSFDGYAEKNAVSVGTTSSNDRVFVCRAQSDGGLLIGTLYPSERVCIIKYDDLPLRKFDKYQVLVRHSKEGQFLPDDI